MDKFNWKKDWKKRFDRVCEIKAKSENGKIKEDAPQNRYKNYKKLKLHKYGNGKFCSLFPVKVGHDEGTYILTINGIPYYVGECVDLYKRFNWGYGKISPRNCYEGGQQTNCRINKEILEALKNGKRILLYFYKNQNRESIETEVISQLGTRRYWNKKD